MKRGPKPRQVTQELLLEKIAHHAARGLSPQMFLNCCYLLWQKC